MIIYKHTINNSSYIGQTKRTMEIRLREHIRDAQNGKRGHFYNAIRKYGVGKITSEILEDNISNIYDIFSKQSLIDEKEIFYIDKYDTYNNGYNLTMGGFIGGATNLSLKGVNHRGSNNPMFGIHHTKEGKKNISEAKKGKIIINRNEDSYSFFRNNNPMDDGHTPETKEKLSKMYKGKKLADRMGEVGARNVIEAAKKNIGIINPNSKKTIVIDNNGTEYDYSGKFDDVYKDFGVHVATLRNTLKTNNPISKGKFKGWIAKRVL